MSAKRVAAAVLAAGSSSRMGTPKQLLEIDGKTLLRRTVETVLASQFDLIVVVLTKNEAILESELRGLSYTRAEVENPQLGQSESIRAALRVVEPLDSANFCDAILFTPCDLPLLESSHLNALITKYRSENWPIVASRYAGILGAPLILGRQLWPELHQLRGDVGARKIVARHEDKATFIEWEAGQFDLDTPQDVADFWRGRG